jgi:rhodanese-related sulfurtransferase
LSIVSYPERILPKSKGQIEAELVPQKPGQFRYEITVETEGTPQTKRLFLLDVTVVGSAIKAVKQAKPIVPPPLRLPSHITVKRDEKLYISVDQLARDLKEGRDVTVVDVRDGQAYTAAHIPESLSIPLYLVKTKGFLRAKPVVLVDAGWGSEVVENECRRLKNAGFSDISILRGGLNAWQSNDGRLDGTNAGKLTLAKLDSLSFLSARRFDDWMVVNTGLGANSTGGLIPEEVRVPYPQEGEKQFVRDIQALVDKHGSFTRLLIVNDYGGEHHQIQEALSSLQGCTVFYLAGGLKALEEQLNMMEAMKNRQEKTTGTISVASGKTIRKPCGSCP